MDGVCRRMVMSGRVRLLLVLIALASACTRKPVPDERVSALLADDPSLPAFAHVDGYRRSLSWELAVSAIKEQPGSSCPGDGIQFARSWTNGGDPLDRPVLIQRACRYREEQRAADVFAEMSSREAFGDWASNLDSPEEPRSGDPAVFPEPAPRLPLHAERFEVVCGMGDARESCGAWFYRGLYGPAITTVRYVSWKGDLTFEEFARIVVSIDAEVAAALGQA